MPDTVAVAKPVGHVRIWVLSLRTRGCGRDSFRPRFQHTKGEVMAVLDPETGVLAEVRDGVYGDAVGAIEPGGAEFIPLSERHGDTRTLFGTWTAPNLEFATVFVGVIAVTFFGQSFWAAALAIVLGTALGSLA